ncbi:MAG: ABC transporter ATP-binding protein [Proteobacteria bacterium]|nr:ABC transporter ATP-binding protein [Pseudomonadota bacterium]MDA0861464.1 ABC transporter ATP-binding protein [Pseudomonadota bacterium]MDA1031019.1 ABC transporter ATP-binding protein [Pseudomonadota bacterium]
MSNALMTVKDLHSHYGMSHVLRGVSLEINSGETIALMGRNGMGKTTLIKCLLGLVPATSGDIKLRDQDAKLLSTHLLAKAGIAYVPEGRGIFKNLSVKENLFLAARSGFEGRMDWTYDRVLDSFPRLKERLTHGGQQLSGGEQQMLSIGRALLTNPDLLILDEATEGLAPLIAQDIWNIIDVIKDSGISTLIVDKNFKSLSKISNRCVVMVKGEIVFNDISSQLIARPQSLKSWLGV